MSKPVILCVDDESMVLISLKQQLKRHFNNDYTIEIVDNGEEALELVTELVTENIDLPVAISDQIMPGMKGDQLLGEIHKLSPHTLNVLLTGQAGVADIGNAVNRAKLYRYLPKPWEQEDLLLTVNEAVRSFFQAKQLAQQNILLREMNSNLGELNLELKKRLDIFYKFVPSQFLKVLNLNEYDAIEQGRCVERVMSVMFADIRKFTTLTEQLLLEESFRFINSYYSHIGPAIRKHNGFIDKYIGDAIMALYESSDDAVQGAVDMQAALAEYNEGRKRAGYMPIEMGIGINTGHLIMGTVGEEDRIQTTVIGDMVNLAARIEGLTKEYNTPILITDKTYLSLAAPQRFITRLLDRVKVRGKENIVTVYEVLDNWPPLLHNPKNGLATYFTHGVKQFQAGDFAQAAAEFQQCLSLCPNDSPTRLYLERLRQADSNSVALETPLSASN